MTTEALLEKPLHVCIYPRVANGIQKPRLNQDRVRVQCYGDVLAWAVESCQPVAIEGGKHYRLCVSPDGEGWYHYDALNEVPESGALAGFFFGSDKLAAIIWNVVDLHAAFEMEKCR